MKATVCQLPDDPASLEEAWPALAAHVAEEGSDLVLLPEMPFSPWLPARREPDPEAWRAAVETHDRWLDRLDDLAPAAVAGTRPVLREGRRLNEAFVWDGDGGLRTVHAKRHLPDEPGFWESSWYEAGEGPAGPVPVKGAKAGFLICTELWFPEHVRSYVQAGVHLLLCPRATPGYSAEKWVAAGRTSAVLSGAWCLSSNRGPVGAQAPESGHAESDGADAAREPEVPGGSEEHPPQDPGWAGRGWIVEPEEGRIVELTSAEAPFLTRVVAPEAADAAKETYPRYVHLGRRWKEGEDPE